MGLGIEAIVGIDAEADAGGDVQIVLIDGMGFGDGLQDFFRGDGHVARLLYFGEKDDELVASLTTDRIRSADAVNQACGDGFQELVSDQMT
jgi:hypothetical protein